MALDCDYFTVDLDPFEFDAQKDKCIDVRVQCRGDSEKMKSKYIHAAIQHVKTNKNVTFVEWCTTGFRLRMNENKLTTLKYLNDNLNLECGSICCVQNSTAIMRYFLKKFVQKYDKMYSQRAYVHCMLEKEWKNMNLLKQEKIWDF